VTLVACVAVVLALVAASRPREPREPRSKPGAATRFGGVATALAQRARRGSMPLGHWALRGWLRTPLRLGATAPGSVLVVGPTQSGNGASC
jgi:hypothetical protein